MDFRRTGRSVWITFRVPFQILDFYHASEHLGKVCGLYKNPEKGQQRYAEWYQMFLDGEVLQVISEMKVDVHELSSSDEGWKKPDNEKFLKARMSKINGYLESHYQPSPQPYTFSCPKKAA